jgi:hypothetical protein
MQAGVPVIACTDPNTDVGKTIVDGGFGWWCLSNDASGFDKVVSEALNADLDTMEENAFALLKAEYTVDKARDIILK